LSPKDEKKESSSERRKKKEEAILPDVGEGKGKEGGRQTLPRGQLQWEEEVIKSLLPGGRNWEEEGCAVCNLWAKEGGGYGPRIEVAWSCTTSTCKGGRNSDPLMGIPESHEQGEERGSSVASS